MKLRHNLIGLRYGRLIVVSFYGKKGNHYAWNCVCDCGVSKVVTGTNLKTGNTASCGCLKFDGTDIPTEEYKQAVKSPAYKSWHAMITRCTNKNSKDWQRYGKQGIACCDEWLSFKNFYRDMGNRPQGTTIDRIDNKKGYSPENCRWATIKEQATNKSSCNYITYNGETKTISEWANLIGLKWETLKARINKGWSIERALTTPLIICHKVNARVKYSTSTKTAISQTPTPNL